MNTHQNPTPSSEEVQVVIPDEVWEQMRGLPPDAYDRLATQIAELKANPEGVDGGRSMTPIPVDHRPGRERTYIPATRSIGYLRNAVADISPATVSVFDEELREDTADPDPEEKVSGVRNFVHRWIEYIGFHGDHDMARHVQESANPQEFANRFREAMLKVQRECFPDAMQPGVMTVRSQRTPKGIRYLDPVTMLRAEGTTEEEAQNRLKAAILSWVTG